MEAPEVDKQERPRGYALAIALSAVGHAVLIVLLLFVLPRWLQPDIIKVPSYSVKIVDSIPAGDLGTHLPPLAAENPPPAPQPQTEPAQPPPSEPKPETLVKPPERLAPETDKRAFVLAVSPTPKPKVSPRPTPSRTPTPTPSSTPTLTETPTVAPTHKVTVRATPKPTPSRVRHLRATPKPTRSPRSLEKSRNHPSARPTPPRALAAGRATPTVAERLQRLREKLLAEHLSQAKKNHREEPSEEAAEPETTEPEADEEEGSGPISAKSATEGAGAGVGAGSGSAGTLNDLQFLLYYRSVQERIKKAWSFSGGNNDLTTTVFFAIAPDGKLKTIKVNRSSKDAAFDDSVVRAIRRAAPFAPPPEKYRDQFGQGIEAVFKLGELNP